LNFITNLSKRTKTIVIVAVLLIAALIVGLSFYGKYNTLNTEGVRQEQALNAQYLDNKNELSAYTNTVLESLGVADRQSDKVKEILTEAVQGRYGKSLGEGSQLFTVISEAYPDLTATSQSYAKVQDAVASGRAAFKNKQTVLLSKVEEYNKWRKTGLIQRNMISSLGFPSDDLVVKQDGRTFRGEDALDKMSDIITSSQAEQSYDTGTSDPLIGGSGK
jgi:hypothetical protein